MSQIWALRFVHFHKAAWRLGLWALQGKKWKRQTEKKPFFRTAVHKKFTISAFRME